VSGDGRSVVFVSSVPPANGTNRRRLDREAASMRHVYLRNLHNGVILRINGAPGG
jgi:hypothetical protein